MAEKVAHLVFDVESVADGELVSKVRYPGANLSPEKAIATYQDELMEQRGTTLSLTRFKSRSAWSSPRWLAI